MRRRAKTDANHQAVIDALRAVGCSVWSTHQLGGGFPDLCVSRAGSTMLLEVKDGAKAKLTEDEARFFKEWAGQVAVVRSAKEAVDYVLTHS